MVNFHDPHVLLSDLVALLKFTDVLHGLYIWEFVSNLDYEWSVIRGHRPYRWTIWIYSIARLATLIAVIMNLIGGSIDTPATCQVLTSLCFIFSYLNYSLSSLLIVLRIIAIWNKNKLIVGLATGVWLTSASIFIYGLTQIRSRWDPELVACSLPNIKSNRSAIIAMLASDIILLFIMFVGLFRLRHRGGGTFGLAKLLWKQGVVYLLAATAAELPPLVFIYLDLNEAFDVMFLMPSLITMAIAATRIHRSLVEGFYNNNSGKCSDNPPAQKVGHKSANAIWATTTQNPPNRMEVSVHTSYEHWGSPAAGARAGQHVSFINIERQMGDWSGGTSLNDDVESGAEK